MGNCFSVLRNDQESPRSKHTPSTSRCTSTRLCLICCRGCCSTGDIDDGGREPLLTGSKQAFQSVEERRPFDENRLSEQNASDKSTANVNRQCSVSENVQNEHASDELEQTPIKKVQTSLQEKDQTPTRRKKKDSSKSPVEIWQEFSKEFKIAAEGVKSKIASKMVFDTSVNNQGETHKVHVLFTLSQAAAIVDIRNLQKLTKGNIEKLRCSQNALIRNRYDPVYAYMYVNQHTYVSDPVKEKAKSYNIKIISIEDLSPDQLVVKIDEELQLASDPTTVSGATKSQRDETDSVPVPEETHLSDRDHYNIYTKLKSHAADWREIGGALGFQQGELNNIQSDLILTTQSAPKRYLGEMLSHWLQWAPGDGRGSTGYATRESLVVALRKANLGRLAESFQ